ncbi:MAG: hypothetical protein IPK37_15470 [Austwickia sp.]|jgi:hypothetical protein|nr:MAG: hypothetical protein IPK37_15470 [Austwickia sp.]
MPIVLVHGVAVRVEDDPAFATVARFTGGFPMGPIEAQLRAHVTSAINPGHPDDVPIRTVYWGDLGTPPPRQASRHVGTGGADGPGNADELDRAALGELLEEAVRSVLPAALWPEAVWCTWRVVDEALADGTPPADLDLAELAERVRAGLVDGIPNLDHWYAHVLTRLQARSRERANTGPLGDIPVDSADPERDVAFWSAMTGWHRTMLFGGVALRHPSGRGTHVSFWPEPAPKPADVKNRLHLDVRPSPGEPTADCLARALDLGATRVAEPWAQGHDWTVLRDPSGNEFCLLAGAS